MRKLKRNDVLQHLRQVQRTRIQRQYTRFCILMRINGYRVICAVRQLKNRHIALLWGNNPVFGHACLLVSV